MNNRFLSGFLRSLATEINLSYFKRFFFRLIEIVSTDQSNMKAVIVPYVFKSLSDSGLSYLEPLKFAAQNFHINLFANMATANLKNVRYVHHEFKSYLFIVRDENGLKDKLFTPEFINRRVVTHLLWVAIPYTVVIYGFSN